MPPWRSPPVIVPRFCCGARKEELPRDGGLMLKVSHLTKRSFGEVWMPPLLHSRTAWCFARRRAGGPSLSEVELADGQGRQLDLQVLLVDLVLHHLHIGLRSGKLGLQHRALQGLGLQVHGRLLAL